MSDATNIIAMIMMELTSEDLIDSGFFDDEEEIAVFGAVITFMRRNLTRIQGYYEGTIPEYMPSEFQCHFRMTRSTMEILCREMANTGQIPLGNPRGRAAIPLEKQILVFVWCMANQEGARLVADRFDITMSSVDRVLRRGAKALVNLSPRYIKWPNERRMDTIKQVFEEGGFPGVVGIIDGTHISIRAPMEESDAYTNRKKFYSIQVQVVCDENMVFLDILAGWPGSVHDSRVLRNSALFNQAGNRFPANSHLLGDGGYPLLPWLMIPFKDNGHLTVPKRHFNTVLSSLRQTVERSIRLLKGR